MVICLPVGGALRTRGSPDGDCGRGAHSQAATHSFLFTMVGVARTVVTMTPSSGLVITPVFTGTISQSLPAIPTEPARVVIPVAAARRLDLVRAEVLPAAEASARRRPRLVRQLVRVIPIPEAA